MKMTSSISARFKNLDLPEVKRSFSHSEAQEGRRRMKRKCIEVALANTPKNLFSIQLQAGLRNSGDVTRPANAPTEVTICSPKPVTRRALYVYLCQCYKVYGLKLYQPYRNMSKSDWALESRAGRWAKKVMRNAGLAVPRKQVQIHNEKIWRLYNGR
jgi:hypothetical protein